MPYSKLGRGRAAKGGPRAFNRLRGEQAPVMSAGEGPLSLKATGVRLAAIRRMLLDSYSDSINADNLIRDMSDIEKCQANSFHAWVEDSEGNIVYDPQFSDYKYMKAMHDCDVDEPMVYHRYDNQDQCRNIVMKRAIQRSIRLASLDCKENGVAVAANELIRPGFCSVNCLNFLRGKQGRGYKVVVGAAGWKQKSGGIWYEWG